MKNGKSCKNVIRQKGYVLSMINGEKLSKACSFRFLLGALSLGDKMIVSLVLERV